MALLEGEYSCRVCRVPLNVLDHGDGTFEYLHAREWEQFDHDPEPGPAAEVGTALVCDFCAAPDPAWSYSTPHETELRGDENDRIESFGTIWAACAVCDRAIRRRDAAALIRRHAGSETRSRMHKRLRGNYDSDQEFAEAREREQALVVSLMTGLVAVLGHREPITPPQPVPKLLPKHLHRTRRRLVSTWGSELIRSAFPNAPEPMNYPGADCGSPEFCVPLIRPESSVVDRLVTRMQTALNQAQLWWVSEDFTRLSIRAGQRLPDLSVLATDLPSRDGLVVFATPVMELPGTPGQANPLIVALSWMTLADQGVWVTLYCQPEQLWPDQDRTALRELVGPLYPAASGAGIPFGLSVSVETLLPPTRRVLGTLLALWALAGQDGVASVQDAAVDKAQARSYARANDGARLEPVKIIDVRRLGRVTGTSQSGRTYTLTKRSLVGGGTGGFWRNQAHGPRRSLRKRIWIDPFVRGPDGAPFADDLPTVRVIR